MMFGSDGVSQTSFDSEISRNSKRMRALEIRLQLMEDAIKTNPDLLQAYKTAWAKASEKRMKDELSWMGCGL